MENGLAEQEKLEERQQQLQATLERTSKMTETPIKNLNAHKNEDESPVRSLPSLIAKPALGSSRIRLLTELLADLTFVIETKLKEGQDLNVYDLTFVCMELKEKVREILSRNTGKIKGNTMSCTSMSTEKEPHQEKAATASDINSEGVEMSVRYITAEVVSNFSSQSSSSSKSKSLYGLEDSLASLQDGVLIENSDVDRGNNDYTQTSITSNSDSRCRNGGTKIRGTNGTSSENISNPYSGRSRSSSPMLSDCTLQDKRIERLGRKAARIVSEGFANL